MLNLFAKYLNNQCSPEEVNELLEHFNVPGNEALLRSLIQEALLNGDAEQEKTDEQTDLIRGEIFQQINKQLKANSVTPVKVVSIYQKAWFRIAASVVILFSVASYFVFRSQQPQKIAAVKTEKKIENDIAPATDKPILTLADGTKIILDNKNTGMIAKQGSATIMNTEDGLQLVNASSKEGTPEVFYNTISTPRGSQYGLVLPDGSKVWLNAMSSVHFPSAFVGKERKVEMTGEAYFEVTKNQMMPFRVEVNGMEVEVVGTHFNINSYLDEPSIKTTLLEGAVKIKKGDKIRFLSPGQQAEVKNTGEIKLVNDDDVDLDKTMAWKNGKFIFADDDIQGVMRQLEKWYDINVEYRGSITKELFVGVISRDVNLSQILNMLEKTGAIKFEISGRKVIIN